MIKTETNSILKINKGLKSEDTINEKDVQYKQLMHIYNSAIKVVQTKLDIIQDEYKVFYNYNPIDHTNFRIKSFKSIKSKLKKKNCGLTYEEMIENINDIAGIRVICNFEEDIYKLVDILENSPELKIIKKKDYIKNKKKSGYSSYHMIINVPINFMKDIIYVKVEIQLRTVGMDFWASMEHKFKYKTNIELTKKESQELVKYAKVIQKMEREMLRLSKKCLVE